MVTDTAEGDEFTFILSGLLLFCICEYFYELFSVVIVGRITTSERAESMHPHFFQTLIRHYFDIQAVIAFVRSRLPQPLFIIFAILINDVLLAYPSILTRRVKATFTSSTVPNAAYYIHTALGLTVFVGLAAALAACLSSVATLDKAFMYAAVQCIISAVPLAYDIARLGTFLACKTCKASSATLLRVGFITGLAKSALQLGLAISMPFVLAHCRVVTLTPVFVIYSTLPQLYMCIISLLKTVREYTRFTRALRLFAAFPAPTPEELSDAMCSICYDALTIDSTGEHQPIRLPCGHIFHLHCMRSWAARSRICPVCRARYTAQRTNRDAGHGRRQEPAAARIVEPGHVQTVAHGPGSDQQTGQTRPGPHIVWLPVALPEPGPDGEQDPAALRAAYMEAARRVCVRQEALSHAHGNT